MILKSQDPVVAIVRNNVLYAGVPNAVIIAVPGIETNELDLISNNLRIEKIEGNHYLLTPISNSIQAELSFISIHGNDTTQLGSWMFKIKQIPSPALTFANQVVSCSEISIERNQIRTFPLLSFRYDDDFSQFNLSSPAVVNFSISYMLSGKITTKEIKGDKIPVVIVNEILSSADLESIVIDNINVRLNSGIVYREKSFKVILN